MTGALRDSRWWGVSGLFAYRLMPRLEAVVRADYLNNSGNGGGLYGSGADARDGIGPEMVGRDADGRLLFRNADLGASRYALAVGVNYVFNANVSFKAEYRLDHADAAGVRGRQRRQLPAQQPSVRRVDGVELLMREPRAAHAPWLSYVCLASSMALVGSYVGLSKLLVLVFPVFLLAWLRFGIAAVAMAALGARERRRSAAVARTTAGCCSSESFLGNFLFSICMLFGVALTLGARGRRDHGARFRPRWPCCRACSCGERIAPRVIGAASAARSAGIALVSLATQTTTAPAARPRWLGNLLLLGAVVCEASYVVIGKKLTAQRVAAAHQRADQPLGPCAGDAVRRCGRRCASTSARSPRRSWALLRVLCDRRQHHHASGCG